MTKYKIVYQGEPWRELPDPGLPYRLIRPTRPTPRCRTFEDAFNVDAARRQGRPWLMIPIENSVAGRVADIHHLMPHSGLHIIGEYFMPVHHQLMAPKGASLKTLKTVESHIHALGQCRKAIRALGLKAVVAGDTAGSARQVAEANDKTRASLAPALAAKIYGLKILQRDCEDEKHNTTRFVVLSRKPKWAPKPKGKAKVVTTFVFEVRNIPAALYKALGGFATNGINMTKLESYMVRGSFTATQFFADVEAHPEDRALVRAPEELKFVVQPKSFRILGVYPAHKHRAKLNGDA